MGQVEYKMDSICKGSSALVPILGGFLDVKIDGNTICTASVPMPDYMPDYIADNRYRDSVSQWNEEFHDDDGNTYVATVYSSMHGVEWEISIESEIDGVKKISDEIVRDISSKITIDLHCTEDT